MASDGVTFTRGAARWRGRAWLAAAFALLSAASWLAFTPRGGEANADQPEKRLPATRDESVPRNDVTEAQASRSAERSVQNASEDGGVSGSPQQLPRDASSEAASGIGLFPPPGTDPVKIGIVVPDDFPLPEGYLRHHQVTDDGQPMPPILMFHPDYELLDERGQPIPLPEDRVVPPELAPEGLPIELLVPPEPREEEGAP